jgi:hypothetical protein
MTDAKKDVCVNPIISSNFAHSNRLFTKERKLYQKKKKKPEPSNEATTTSKDEPKKKTIKQEEDEDEEMEREFLKLKKKFKKGGYRWESLGGNSLWGPSLFSKKRNYDKEIEDEQDVNEET